MNVLIGTKLAPNNVSNKMLPHSRPGAVKFRSNSTLMMHHTTPAASQYRASSSQQDPAAFDWRSTGIVISPDWFAPQKRSEVVGNARAIDEFDQWARQWRRANSATTKRDFTVNLPERCCAFVRGPPGVGKCTAVNLLLRKHGYTDIVHIDAGAMHSRQLVNDRLLPLLLNANSRRAIVVDELDGLHYTGGSSANASDALLRFLSNDSHNVTWGESRKQRTMARGGLAQFAPFYDDVSEWRLKQSKSGCVTSCPVVLIASDHQYQFVFKSLERSCGTHANREQSAYFLFRPVRTEDTERRYAQLAARYNFYTRAKNVKDGKAEWLLLHDLATVAGGDMRKAVTMLLATVRRAYVDKQARQCRGKEDDCVEKRLVLRRRHCEALLRCQTTVQTSPFQACSFLLHDCPSVFVALEHIARFRMNNVPDMLFGGFHKITPVGKNLPSTEVRRLARAKQSVRDVENRHALAGLVRLADTGDAFSRADVYRQRFDYVRNESTQQVYHDSITMWSLLLLNHEQGAEGYVLGDGRLGMVQQRTFCRNFSNCRKKDCNCRWMQKASLEAQRGQRAQWQRMAIEERNQYDQQTGQKMQTSTDRFLYFRNYVNSVQQVRAKGQQLASITDTALSDLYSDEPKPKRTKKAAATKRKTAATTDNAKRKTAAVADRKRARVIESNNDNNDDGVGGEDEETKDESVSARTVRSKSQQRSMTEFLSAEKPK